MSYKPSILVTGPVATRSGYGAHTRDIVRSLIAMNKFDIQLLSLRWGNTPMNALQKGNPNDDMIIERLLPTPEIQKKPDIHIQVSVPNEFSPIGNFNIGVTAGLECTVCPPKWIEGLNRMDLNIVPSTFVRDVIQNSVFDITNDKTGQKTGTVQYSKPIEVLFEGADTNIYKKTKEFSKDLINEFKNIKESFNFLYVGHWLQGGMGQDRKDTGMLVKVFLETFKNKKNTPGLIMKTSGAAYSVLDRENMLDKINTIKKEVKADTLPNIYLLHGDLSDEEMNGLYNHPRVKAHVNITHGEGFGRPILEASLSGKPSIVSGWSGHLDFMSKQLAILVGGSLTNVPKSSFPKEMYVEGSKWFTANYVQTADILNEVFLNYKKYTSNANKLSTINKGAFSLKKMTSTFETILEKYLPVFSEPVKLKLPKLKKAGNNEPPKIKLPKLKKV